MKRFVFAVIAVALLASVITVLAQQQPGYVLIQWWGYSIELSVWLLIVTVLVIYVLLRGALFIAKRILGIPVAASNWLFKSDDAALQSMTAHALAAFEEGHWQRARKLLDRVGQNSQNPLIFYLLAARASHAEANPELVSAFLAKATQHAPSASSMAINLTQAQLQLADGALENCLATLVRAHAMDEEHPEVIKMLAKVYVGLKDWQQLRALLPQLKRLRLFPSADYTAYEERCYEAILSEAAGQGCSNLEDQWRQAPRSVKTNPVLILTYARCLRRFTRAQEPLKKLLESAIADGHSTAELLLLYSSLDFVPADAGLRVLQATEADQAPSVLAAHYLAMARFAVKAGVQGQARAYLNKAESYIDQAGRYVASEIHIQTIESALAGAATPVISQALRGLQQIN